MTAAAVLDRAEALKAEVAEHNLAIRRHRKQRREAQAALESLAATCRRLGIHIVIEPQHSEGAVHGPSKPHQ